MTTSNVKAWMAREYLTGRTQRDIGEEMGVTSPAISIHLKQFCREWANKDVYGVYNDERKKCILAALEHWFMETGHEPVHPALEHTFGYNGEVLDFFRARVEHAWLLRAEGMTYRQIGNCLGVSRSRADQMVARFARRMRRAMRRTSWSVTT